MRPELLRTSAVLVLTLLGTAGIAAAQQSPPAEPQQQQQQQEKAQQTPSGKMGKEEPSSHAPSDKPADNSVFVNGALAVPGAPANTDTVPAKFSEKNADDDKLITLAYTFKLLTDEQRRAIYEGLKGFRRPGRPSMRTSASSCPPRSSCVPCRTMSLRASHRPRTIATQ